MAEAYFVCHIGPIFQISLIYAFIVGGVFRTFELRVLKEIDYPKIAGAKGR
jgi:hypothetical protein